MKKLRDVDLLKMTGTVMAVGSAVAIADYVVGRRDHIFHTGKLIAGIAGLLIGSALIAEPDIRAARKNVAVDDLFDEAEENTAHEQIRETLNKTQEAEAPQETCKRTIEVDEETSIEDFI